MPQIRSTDGDLVSVVVPTRNRRERLARTLTSIRWQDHAPLEIVIADDGSTDGTADWVRSLGDDRIRLAASPVGTGVSRARNRGIAAATGRWIAVCDDDDIWSPDKISQQLAALAATGAAWSFCGSVSVEDDLEPIHVLDADGHDLGRRLAEKNVVPGGCSSVLVDRELLVELGGFDPRLSMFADYDVWLALAAHGEPAVWTGLGVLYVYHDGQMTRRKLASAVDELEIIRDKHAGFLRQHQVHPPTELDRWLVSGLRNAGDRRTALRYVARTVDPVVSKDGLALGLRAVVGRPVRRDDQVDGGVRDHVAAIAAALDRVPVDR